MLARPEPGARDQRVGRERGAAHDVGVRDRSLEVVPRRRRGSPRRSDLLHSALLRQPSRRCPRTVDVLDRAHGAKGIGQVAGDAASAHHQQPPRIGAREVARRQRRGGGGAPVGDLSRRPASQGAGPVRASKRRGRTRRRAGMPAWPALPGLTFTILTPADARRVPRGHQEQGSPSGSPVQRAMPSGDGAGGAACGRPRNISAQRLRSERAERQQVPGLVGTVDAHGPLPCLPVSAKVKPLGGPRGNPAGQSPITRPRPSSSRPPCRRRGPSISPWEWSISPESAPSARNRVSSPTRSRVGPLTSRCERPHSPLHLQLQRGGVVAGHWRRAPPARAARCARASGIDGIVCLDRRPRRLRRDRRSSCP